MHLWLEFRHIKKEELDFNRISLCTILEYTFWEEFTALGIIGYSYYYINRERELIRLSQASQSSKSFYLKQFYLGYGGKVMLTDNLSFRGQWIRPFFDSFKFDTIKLSLELNFDKI